LCWTENGAELLGKPIRCQYLPKEKISDTTKLYLEYGVPRVLYTPECYYEIKTTQHGNSLTFLYDLLTEFPDSVISLSDYEVSENINLGNIVRDTQSTISLR
jgi:hypothetical protein